MTAIEWTRGDDGSPGETWNPTTGCDRVSAGCDNCYALTLRPVRWRGRVVTAPTRQPGQGPDPLVARIAAELADMPRCPIDPDREPPLPLDGDDDVCC